MIFFCKAGLAWVSQEQCQKKIVPYLFLQSRACLSFHKSMCRRSIVWDPDFFWQSRACLSFTRAVPKKIVRAWFFFGQSRACLSFTRAVPKKQLFGAWKIVFLQSLSFLQVLGEKNVSGSQVYPHINFERIESSPSTRGKNNFSEHEKLSFCKA